MERNKKLNKKINKSNKVNHKDFCQTTKTSAKPQTLLSNHKHLETYVSKNVLLKGPENSKPFESFYPKKRTRIHSSSNDKGLRDIGFKMSMVFDTRKSSFRSH